MKLLHLADIHLGIRAKEFGDRAVDLRDRIQTAFANALMVAPEHDCKVVLIAGDLFDSNRTGKSTVQRAVNAMQDLFERVPETQIIAIPGNHDCLGEGSVYNAPEFDQLDDRFHLITDPNGQTVHLPLFEAAVHAVPFVCDFKGRAMDMLDRIQPDPDVKYNIGMVHAGTPMFEQEDKEAPEITSEQIAACGMDYLALGHFHSSGECDAGGVVARYSGPPELINLKTDPGAALVVDITESGVSVTPEKVSSLRIEELQIPGAELSSTEDLRRSIAERAGEHVVLDVEVSGMLPVNVTLDIDRIFQELSDDLYRLRIKDHTIIPDESILGGKFPEQLVSGKFARLMQDRIKQARELEDRATLRIAQEALRTGLHLLTKGDRYE